MINRLVRAELLKLRTAPTTWILLLVSALVCIGFTALDLFVALDRETTFGSVTWYRDLLGASGSFDQLMVVVVGILCVTGEFRHGTVTGTFLAVPRRGDMVIAKLVAVLVTAAVFCVVSFAASVVFDLALFPAKHVTAVSFTQGSAGGLVTTVLHPTASALLGQVGAVLPGLFLATLLFGVLGVGVGALLRNQVMSVVVSIVALFVVQGIIGAAFPGTYKWLPEGVSAAVANVTARSGGRGPHAVVTSIPLFSWWVGGLLLLGYGVVLATLGAFTTLRRDIT
jgi:hypothetical protein